MNHALSVGSYNSRVIFGSYDSRVRKPYDPMAPDSHVFRDILVKALIMNKNQN